MPLARYFVLVGGVLLALVFISDLYFPKSPVVATADVDRQVIRIHSDRKWPDRIVFDTNVPTISPPPAQTVASIAPAEAEVPAKAREAFAQLPSDEPKRMRIAEVRKPEPKPLRKRKIARRRVAPSIVVVAQQPQFGFFGSSNW
ncbi:MAG: hypothetical protein QOC84_1788 [Bradyrhizobium sp.]|jgi:hypothetical protein|nr:hypothetical protein [Bradyrhizobium sp.]